VIYEIRTYQIAPGSLAEVEKRFGDAYQYRKKYSELTAFLHTEVGPLNEIVHIWGYKDLADRARVRGEASKEANWPPSKLGPVYELRYYTLKPGTLPDMAKGWESKIADRAKLSPIVFAGPVEFGRANGFVHIWAYSSMDNRMQVRDDARKKGVWPPPGGGDRLLTQENKILLPSAFSPLQ